MNGKILYNVSAIISTFVRSAPDYIFVLRVESIYHLLGSYLKHLGGATGDPTFIWGIIVSDHFEPI